MENDTTVFRGQRANAQPEVSVIIPAYNTAQFIGEALESVLAQTYPSVEAVVVNDGSPDTEQMEKALAPFRDRIVYIVQKNKRAAGARNTGIRHSRGEFLAFLDSDDSLTPEAIAVQMAKFRQDPLLDVVYGDALLFGGTVGKTCMEVSPSVGEVTFANLVQEKTQVCIVGAVARKAIVEKVGLFDESLRSCDDYDMWLRIAHAGGRFAYHRTVIGNSRVGRPGSLGASDLAMAKAVMEILSKLDGKIALADEQRLLVRRRIAFYQAEYDRDMAKVYLSQRDYANAAASLERANSFFNSAKLRLALLLLRRSPNLLRVLSNARER